MVALPDPRQEPDAFYRKIAHLQRVQARAEEQSRAGTLGALIDQYRGRNDAAASNEYEQLKPSTKLTYGTYLDRLQKNMGMAVLADLEPSHIQERVLDANRDTPGAANMLLAVLRTLYRFAIKRNPRLADWTKGLDPLKGGREHQPWALHVLTAALKSNDQRFRLAVMLHLYTGQRTGDTCAMRWEDIQDGHIPVRQDKTGIELWIPLHADLGRALKDTPREGEYILTNRTGRPLTSGTFRAWCAIFGATHGAKIVPHGLRKNAVNALLEVGCTVFEVHSITGQSLQMVEHYAKRVNRRRGAAEAMRKWDAGTKTERENNK